MSKFTRTKKLKVWSIKLITSLALIFIVESNGHGNSQPPNKNDLETEGHEVEKKGQRTPTTDSGQKPLNSSGVFEDPGWIEIAQIDSGNVDNETSTSPDNNSELVIPAQKDDSMESEAHQLPSRNLDAQPKRTIPGNYSLPSDMTKDIENPDELVEVKFNFDAESIVNVAQMFSITLDFEYYIDPGVSGSVTMTIDTEMTRKEAWELFEHILWITGSYASRQNRFIHILPFAKMPQERRIFAKHDPIPNVDVSIVRLFNSTAADIVNLIRPFMTAGATANPIQHLNSLLIIEAPPNMPKILELIEKLDIMGETKWPQISIPLYHVGADVILEELQQILPIIGFPVTGAERGDGHSIKLSALNRLQVVVAAAPVKEVLDEVQRWVRILDTADTVEQERIFFYEVKYNKAEDLSDSISTFFNASSSSTGRSGSQTDDEGATPRSDTDSSRRQRNQRRQQPQRPTSTGDEKPATIFEVPVTILADGNHNRLVIRTTTGAYAVVEAMLQRLDTPPLQVLMQVTIAEITLGDETSHGFQFSNQIESNFSFDFTPGLPDPSLYSINFEDADSADALGVGEIFSRIQAFAGETNTRILFSPQIIAISDEEASINVGDSVPVATRTETGDDTTSRNFTDVQYQDTGTILTVTPYITAKKLVTLDIRQEVSNAVATEVSTINSPTIQTRVVETSLVVEDGSTILIGGLISNEKENINRGFPVLKDVPYLGKLFGFKSEEMTRTEILLLMTVHVVDINTDVDALTKRYQAALQAIEEEFGDGTADEEE